MPRPKIQNPSAHGERGSNVVIGSQDRTQPQVATRRERRFGEESNLHQEETPFSHQSESQSVGRQAGARIDTRKHPTTRDGLLRARAGSGNNSAESRVRYLWPSRNIAGM